MRGQFKLISLVILTGLVNSFISVAQAAEPVREWTYLVFLNGNNNLDRFGGGDINEMEKVGSTEQVNVVVQWASLANQKVQRLLVKKDNDVTKVTSPILQNLGKADMGDYRSLIEFVRWGVQNYPAKHYFVNVWDHGGGWHFQTEFQKSSGMTIKDISWDDTTGHYITTEQLGFALNESAKIMGQRVDIYGSDACLMAMAEVAGEMKEAVQMFVGAQEVEPGDGWPYDDFLKVWNSRPAATPADVSRALVQTYTASYQNGSQGSSQVTLSALNLDFFAEFEDSMKHLSSELMRSTVGERAKISSAIKTTQKFTESDYGDLVDFMTKVKSQKLNAGIDGALNHVASVLQKLVIANAVTSQYERAHGLSVWMPNMTSSYNSYADRYKLLKFNRSSDWGSALRFVLQDT